MRRRGDAAFEYLKLFSWLLLLFAVFSLGAAVFGFSPGIGTGPWVMGVMLLQALVASLILYGFKLHQAGALSRQRLLYGGWSLVLVLIVIGQIAFNLDASGP